MTVENAITLGLAIFAFVGLIVPAIVAIRNRRFRRFVIERITHRILFTLMASETDTRESRHENERTPRAR